MKNVFIIGSKGIPANYGGFETFVDKLTYYSSNKDISYHIACMANNNNEFEYNGARCFNIKVPGIGPVKAVYYDIAALKACIKYIQKKSLDRPVIYILACRMGPFIFYYKNKIKKYNAYLYINPDGHEWKRDKWNRVIKKYWKLSERLMVKHSNLIICDSKNIEKYIKNQYKHYNPKTLYITYGAEIEKWNLSDNDEALSLWYKEKDIYVKEYYLTVGRFVPENNIEIIISEFMKSNTKKDLVIITNVTQNKFYNKLIKNTNFKTDKRIKFTGALYNQDLLKRIRENAYGYIHGHEVGGTNPSLLESMASTSLNLLLDIGFNREVGSAGAVYWNKKNRNLAKLIDVTDKFNKTQIERYGKLSKDRINKYYNWPLIVELYEKVFLKKE